MFSMNSLQTESLKFKFLKNIKNDLEYEQICNKQITLSTALHVPKQQVLITKISIVIVE